MSNTNTAIPTTRTSSTTSYDAVRDSSYPARVVRFIGLGVQDQPEYQGQKKDPAFKCSIQFELIGVDATGTKADGTPIEPRPACVFQDYFLFPGATRGKVYELCHTIDPSLDKAPNNLEWFIQNLNSIVSVQVGHYIDRQGKRKNKVLSVSPVPDMFKNQVGPSRCDLVGFNPYVENDESFAAYSKLFKFQRDMLLEAHDSDNIPYAGKEPATTDTSGKTNNGKPAPAPAYSDDAAGSDDDAPF